MANANRFDASTDALVSSASTAGMPTTTFTATCWFYISATTGAYASPLSMWDSTAGSVFSALDLVMESSDGTTLTIRAGTGSPHLGAFTQSTATWYFAAVTVSGTSATLWHGDTGLGSVSSTAGTLTLAAAPDTFGIGTNVFGNWFNGRVAAVKLWNAVLTQTEIEAEQKQYDPVRIANLLRYYPLTDVPGTTDGSGNGRSLNAGSTAATTEAGPPIPLTLATYTLRVPIQNTIVS